MMAPFPNVKFTEEKIILDLENIDIKNFKDRANNGGDK